MAEHPGAINRLSPVSIVINTLLGIPLFYPHQGSCAQNWFRLVTIKSDRHEGKHKEVNFCRVSTNKIAFSWINQPS